MSLPASARSVHLPPVAEAANARARIAVVIAARNLLLLFVLASGKNLERLPRGSLLGLFLRPALGARVHLGADRHFDFEDLLVVGAGLGDDLVARAGAQPVLRQLLQPGLVVEAV